MPTCQLPARRVAPPDGWISSSSPMLAAIVTRASAAATVASSPVKSARSWRTRVHHRSGRRCGLVPLVVQVMDAKPFMSGLGRVIRRYWAHQDAQRSVSAALPQMLLSPPAQLCCPSASSTLGTAIWATRQRSTALDRGVPVAAGTRALDGCDAGVEAPVHVTRPRASAKSFTVRSGMSPEGWWEVLIGTLP
jgi:hypothetical protein